MDYIGLLIPFGLAVGAGFLGYVLAAKRLGLTLTAVWVALIGVSMALAGMANTTPGWDAITYMVFLVGGCAPAGVGLLIGSLIGWFRHRPDAEGGDTAIPPR